jgi:hypothetical protein
LESHANWRVMLRNATLLRGVLFLDAAVFLIAALFNMGVLAGLRRSRRCTMLPECVVGGGIAQPTGAAGVGVLADVPGGLFLVVTRWSVTGRAGRRQT